MRHSDCHLSIRMEKDSIAASLQDRSNFHVQDHRVIHLEKADNREIESAFESLRPMATAKSVSCSINSPTSTLIPEAVFRPENRARYLGFNSDLSGKEQLVDDPLPLLEARNIYTESEALEIITRSFPQCRMLHESTIEIELSLRMARLNRADAAFLFFSDGFFRMVLIQNGELELANAFSYNSEMDVAYYVLYVFDQLKISPDKFSTYASGRIDDKGSELTLLREYIGPVKLLTKCGLAELNYTPNKASDAQRFFTLFHQLLCVL